jgi:hypothetical protein
MPKKTFIFLVLISIGFGLLAFSFLKTEKVEAGTEHNVWGWAWGGFPELEGGVLKTGSGWIKFNNCTNPANPATCGPINYGVHICTNDTDSLCGAVATPKEGKFIGYAWAGGGEDAFGIPTSTIGWINFAPAGPYPAAPNYSAKVSTTTGEVSGWARACSVFQAGCSGPLKPSSETGGWDGWIKFRGPNYGVWIDTSPVPPNPDEFRNWAWGGDDSTSTAVIGWISFNVKNCDVNNNGTYEGAAEGAPAGCPTSGTAYDYKVMTGFSAPPIAAMECEIPVYGPGNTGCRGPGCVCGPGLWETFNGSEVIFNVNNNSTDADGTIISSIWSILTPHDPWLTCPPFDGPLCDMGRMPGISTSTYDIRLVVEDDAGITGTTSNSIRVKQDTDADFECSFNGTDWYDCEDATNITPLTGQTVYFMSTSKPSEGATQIINWYWEKGEDIVGAIFKPFGSASSTVTTTLTAATNTVRLTVWDDQAPDADYPGGGRTSSAEKTLDVSLPLPEYREVAPTGRLDNFLARLSSILR